LKGPAALVRCNIPKKEKEGKTVTVEGGEKRGESEVGLRGPMGKPGRKSHPTLGTRGGGKEEGGYFGPAWKERGKKGGLLPKPSKSRCPELNQEGESLNVFPLKEKEGAEWG